MAQEADDVETIEEILVTGHRQAQRAAIVQKRSAALVQDSIAAEDIGKLPDVTIADSLQRVPGVQIRRSAGEGGAIAVRGLPQVVTMMNGEQFLSAGSITQSQPNLGDLPASLFKGATVYKGSTSNLGITGITATIDLETYHPFDFGEGLSLAGRAEVGTGDDTGETDPSVSFLASYRTDRIGAMVSASYNDVNLANYYNGFNSSEPTGDSGWVNGVNDWGGTQTYNAVSPQGVVAWEQITSREGNGINFGFQADIGEGFFFTADAFYTDQEEFNRKVGISATDKWQGVEWFTINQGRATGDFGGANDGAEWMSVQEYAFDARRVKSFTQNDSFTKDSTNINLQLDFDNGGAVTGSFRVITADATNERRHGYNEGDLTDGTSTGIIDATFYPSEFCGGQTPVGDEGGCFVPPNPMGYTDTPVIVYNTTGKHPTWSGFDQVLAGGLAAGSTLADYMANEASYNVGAFSSENNADSNADLDVMRLDGSYAFDDGGFVTSVDVGIRQSNRQVQETRFHYFSPFYDEMCDAQWKATDVKLDTGNCQAGELVGGEFEGYTVLPPTPLATHNNVIWVNDFGPVRGIPGVWAVDPKDYDNPKRFHTRVFGSVNKYIIPGTSYELDLDETTYYAQVNFESGRLSGNLGVRVIETEKLVKQNIAGATIPYGNTNVDDGDAVTRIKYTDTLPALNLAFEASDDVIIRFGAAETMTPLDLNFWGDGLSISTSFDQDFGFFVVNDASFGGNPDLDPWRASNYDLSAEWYLGSASLLSAAVFYVDIDSFVQSGTVPMQFPDPDGIIRRTINVSTPVQGDGGTIEGAEIAAKLAFSDFTDGFIGGFGVDANYTYSPSEQATRDISGDKLPFPENSEDQVNVVLWYEQGGFQARLAYNYRSDRLRETNRTSGSLAVYQDAVDYLDVSASYDFTDNVTVFLQGSNVTGSFEEYYMQWEDQYAYQNYYEPRWTVGVRGRW